MPIKSGCQIRGLTAVSSDDIILAVEVLFMFKDCKLYETLTHKTLRHRNPDELLGRVGDHAGLTRQEVALLDALAHRLPNGAA